jgi:phospholipid transport system substrate-binding protein
MGNTMQRVVGLSLMVWLVFSSAAATGASTGPGTTAVKAVLGRAMDIQTRPELQGESNAGERARLVRELIAKSFLASDMAAEALQDHWGKLTPAQRTEYQNLFTDLFQDSYSRMVLNFLQQEKVEYLKESAEGKGVEVQTVIVRSAEKIPVNYYLVQKSGQWLIRDVVIDGLSITENYRNTFRRVIQSSSFDALLQKMRMQSQAIRGGSAS